MIPTERYFRITDNSNEISYYTEKDGTLTQTIVIIPSFFIL